MTKNAVSVPVEDDPERLAVACDAARPQRAAVHRGNLAPQCPHLPGKFPRLAANLLRKPRGTRTYRNDDAGAQITAVR